MMCACDEKIGRRHLPHQLECGVELRTQRRVHVTSGFQPAVCRQCRGLPVQAHPKAEIYRRTSKIRRYYWRELAFAVLERFAEWSVSSDAVGKSDAQRAEQRKRIEEAVLQELKVLHSTTPKYQFKERSGAAILEECKVKIVDLKANYLRNKGDKSAAVLDVTEPCSVEEFAAQHFKRAGFETVALESAPFHVLFGVYMWLVIQDPDDPRVRVVSFGDRCFYDQRLPGELIWTSLPEDFGTFGYGCRRAKAIVKHLSTIIEDRTELQWLFDYWLSPSEGLRQYLWAHRQESIEAARKVVDIIPPPVLKTLLRYLTRNFWGRYLGWPDLLLYRADGWFLAEIKSSGDRLRKNQKRWIEDNHRYLHLPVKLVKIHKQGVKDC